MLKIQQARPTGGKAGKGHNKTSTVQVIDQDGGVYQVLKSFRYKVGSGISLVKAWGKADTYMRELKKWPLVPEVGQKPLPLTRRNLYRRDGGRCRVCGKPVALKTCVFAHVVLLSRGGKTTWDNMVIAHEGCIRERDVNSPLKVRPL